MKKILFIVLVMWGVTVYSGGTIVLEGTLRSFDSAALEIEDGKKTFVLDKTKLPKHLLDSVKNMKAGAKLKMAVGFDAITSIRASKNKESTDH